MLKKSLFSISLVGVGNVMNAVLGFVFLSAVAKTLEVETFGKYALITSILVAVSKIMDFGTNSLYVSQSIAKENDLKNTFLTLKFILFLTTLPISIVVLNVLDVFTTSTAILFFFGLIGYGVNHTLYAFFQKSQQFEFTFLINTLPAFVKASLGTLALLGIINLSFESAFSIFALSILLSSLFYYFVPKNLKGFSFSFTDTFKLFKESASAGTALMIGVSWGALSNSILKLAKTFTDVGIFSLANRIANIFSLISLSIFTVLLPKNAKRKKELKGYDFKETAIIAGGVLLLAVGAIIVGNVFVQIIFGEKFAGSIGVLNILIVASAISAIHTFLNNYFFVEEKTNMILLVTGMHLGAFLILGYLLIPDYSIIGLGYAHLISTCIALATSIFAIYTNKSRN